MNRTAEIIRLHRPDEGNAAARMLPNEISEAMIDETRQRAREMVFSVVVFMFALIGAAWSLGYLVGTISAWWAA